MLAKKLGFILTSLDFALMNHELRVPLLNAIGEIIKRENAVKMHG